MLTPEEEKAKKDAEMEEMKKKDAEEEAKKADADAGQKLDKVLECLDSLGKRMDAMEAEAKKDDDDDDSKKKDDDDAKKADAKRKDDDDDSKKKDADEKPEFLKKEEVAADKKRKDDDDDAKRKDAAKADADISDVKRRIADVEAKLPKAMADADYHALTDAQAKADTHFQAHGLHAPRFMDGETVIAYRKRLASALKVHSSVWKGIDLTPFADDSFAIAEGQIFADSDAAAQNPTDLPDFVLRPVTRTDPTTGQRMTTFYGKNTFISQLKRPSRRVAHLGVRKDN